MNFILRRVDAEIFASSFQHPAKNLHVPKAFIARRFCASFSHY